MTDPAPARETLTIVGGRSLVRVDADAVLAAAGLLDDVAAHLHAAAVRCAFARTVLERWAWAQDPLGLQVPRGRAMQDQAVRRRAVALTGDAAARLGVRSRRAAALATRLRVAAGVYRRSESAAEQVTGAVTTAAFAVFGRLLDTVVLPPLQVGAAVVGVVRPRTTGEVGEAPRWGAPAAPADGAATDAGGPVAELWRQAAPYADEAVTGLAAGVAPFGGVTGGARELAALVHAAMPESDVVVHRVAGGGDGGPPAWAVRPSGTVAEALARTADLYPHGSGIEGRPGSGAPAGTVALEKVTHDDGSTSWTVLIPGTQELVSATNPFDGLTDLELMAREAADVTEGVTRALAEAGAAPDEPVVLVGHSLGGIAAVALASSSAFRARHPVGGVVTAGAPTATFATPRGVPVLHLENDEELVSPADGRSSTENPAAPDRVTVGRALGDSADPADRAASGSISLAHGMSTHLRTLAAARASGNVQVAQVTGRLDALLDGRTSRTGFFGVRRAPADPGVVLAPGPGPLSPSSGRTLR